MHAGVAATLSGRDGTGQISVISPIWQSFKSIIAVPHVRPTPNPLRRRCFRPSNLPFNSEIIVRGIETDDVLPNLWIVAGVFSSGSLSFFARNPFI